MNAYLFNVWLIIVSSIACIEFVTNAFSTYVRLTTVEMLFGVQIKYLKFYNWFYKNDIFEIAFLVKKRDLKRGIIMKFIGVEFLGIIVLVMLWISTTSGNFDRRILEYWVGNRNWKKLQSSRKKLQSLKNRELNKIWKENIFVKFWREIMVNKFYVCLYRIQNLDLYFINFCLFN